MGALLELQKVSRIYAAGENSIPALDAVDLRIEAGEMVAIVGSSGSGKSTLMNILGCLDHPSSGSYLVGGRETANLTGEELAELRRNHFGFIFQRYHLLSHLDALENSEIPAVYAGIGKTQRRLRSRELLERLGLGDRISHKPGQLSGGQQQRVSVARALINGGQVILADEPTGALDSHSGAEMMALLQELNQLGHTVILVTHDQQIASYAERIIEMRDGRILNDRSNKSGRPATVPLAEKQDRGSANSFNAMWGRTGEAFRMAWFAMVSHRLRTLLTMLGIIIGITAVVCVVALGQGAREKIVNDINSMGTNVISIIPGKGWGDFRSAAIHTLVPSDLEALRSLPYVDSATPSLKTSLLLRYGNITASASVTGVSEDYYRVRGLLLDQGNWFSSTELKRLDQVAVIDPNTAKKLFPNGGSPLGRVVLLGTVPCRIIGVTQAKESPFGNNEDLNVWLPYSAAMGRLTGQNYFNSITVRVADGFDNETAENNITRLLTRRHGSQDFYTSSSDTILKTVNKTTATMTLLVAAIAVISLVVGGIGVMNIMLVSVTERTHEIGIRMAVGARQTDIMQQFLIEAILVCLLGGSCGILLSYAIGLAFPFFVTSIKMEFSLLAILAAVLCSTLIGVVFGFLPARNAARLDPVAALARD
ncbi:MacB family efflux pump subunit [Pelobacter seleniigenes]|uniref:MacB family efflux pump subunit n=1 Tax=Pelobacter seleniigenes TaxID=407188 RepID=UPI0004A7467B|nr:MacB family efflux pump subunit [Pelobacter seleniigenes]